MYLYTCTLWSFLLSLLIINCRTDRIIWSLVEKVRFAVDTVDEMRAIFPITVHWIVAERNLSFKEVLVHPLGAGVQSPKRFEIDKIHDFTIPLFEEFQSLVKNTSVPACRAALQEIISWRVVEASKLDNRAPQSRRRIRPLSSFLMSRTMYHFSNTSSRSLPKEIFVPPLCRGRHSSRNPI